MLKTPDEHSQRIRLLYSMRDIQLARSAAFFLRECDEDELVSKNELRRYKCYETTLITAYARPFSNSLGGIPKLSFEMIGVQLDDQNQDLHDTIIRLRNQAIAHSDGAMMRMVVKSRNLANGGKELFPLILAEFDEGLDFIGFKRTTSLIKLFDTVFHGIYSTLIADARLSLEGFDFRKDFLDLEGR